MNMHDQARKAFARRPAPLVVDPATPEQRAGIVERARRVVLTSGEFGVAPIVLAGALLAFSDVLRLGDDDAAVVELTTLYRLDAPDADTARAQARRAISRIMADPPPVVDAEVVA